MFLLYNFTKGQEENRMREIQKSLDMQVAQSMREITALRESQNLASRYRHDLRHHLQYLYVWRTIRYRRQGIIYLISVMSWNSRR